jgi:stage IV sporulation protein FB
MNCPIRRVWLQSKKPNGSQPEPPVIHFREPPRTGAELRWRLFGIQFRVLPSFFILSAVLAYVFVGFNLKAMAVDVVCIFIAIVFTEFVQGLVYRSYGLRSTVLIQEFGGGIYPESEPPTALQRITAALSNPASSFLLFAVVYYSNQEYDWAATSVYANFAYRILWLITLFWGIIGLLPVFPYPGGRVMLEVFMAVSPRNGLVWTLGSSILVGLAYIAYAVAVYFGKLQEIPLFDKLVLPSSILVSIFLAMATIRNFQLLQYANTARRMFQNPADEYDELAPWER